MLIISQKLYFNVRSYPEVVIYCSGDLHLLNVVMGQKEHTWKVVS